MVDVRSTAAYNGWRLNGEARGGHIPGRCSPFPGSGVTDEEFLLLLGNKGITPGRSIVLYGDTPEQVEPLHEKLTDFGYTDIAIYPGIRSLGGGPTLPVESLARYEKLVHPEWLQQLVRQERPDTYRGNGFLLFHVNFGVPEEYEEGHIPGALYLDTNWLESPEAGIAVPRGLQATLTALGISPKRRWSSMAATSRQSQREVARPAGGADIGHGPRPSSCTPG